MILASTKFSMIRVDEIGYLKKFGTVLNLISLVNTTSYAVN